jgi:hypothetical protein
VALPPGGEVDITAIVSVAVNQQIGIPLLLAALAAIVEP